MRTITLEEHFVTESFLRTTSSNTRGRAFLQALPALLNQEDLAQLTYRNAESLLRLKS